MVDDTSLGDILGGGEEAEVEEPQVEEQGVEAEEPQDEPPASEEPEQSHIPVAALKDERTKRQAAEENARLLQERLQQFEAYYAQQQGGEVEEDDPVELFAQQIMGRAETRILEAKVQITETLARQKWDDYDEMADVFKEAAVANPFLVEELKRAPDPAAYAYGVAQKIHEAKGLTTAQTRAQIEAEIREELKAEIGLKAPTSLANAQSKGGRGGPGWTGPKPLEDILG